MPFWTYMLYCSDRTFYVGHTEDLPKRVSQHEQGFVPGYTESRRPVALVWSEVFELRDEARRVEDQLKGWGRQKKLALIRGDWGAISLLAKSKEKEGASTSSASRSRRFEEYLQPHLDTPPGSAFWLRSRLRLIHEDLFVAFRLAGDVSSVAVPALSEGGRHDELWRHTCFECFAQGGCGNYVELNFSPSTEWAAYRFDDYRSGMSKAALDPPRLRLRVTARTLELTAHLSLSPVITPARLGLSAVIEEKSGRKSYWALKHPAGPPDFHHPDCFALELPPPT